jgi:RNA polymerase sigma-70 factor (ECF subfamily)
MSAIAALRVDNRQVDSTIASAPTLDPESREWLEALRGGGREHDEAVARLHELLLRAARFECARRRPTLPHLRGNDLDDIANQAADDALVSILGKLDAFRGASRFTTWAYKFALLEAAVKLRRAPGRGARSRSSPRRGVSSRARRSSQTSRSSRASCWRRCNRRSPRS